MSKQYPADRASRNERVIRAALFKAQAIHPHYQYPAIRFVKGIGWHLNDCFFARNLPDALRHIRVDPRSAQKFCLPRKKKS